MQIVAICFKWRHGKTFKLQHHFIDSINDRRFIWDSFNIQGNACVLIGLGFRHERSNLSNQSGCGNLSSLRNNLWPSADISTFWSYIKSLDRGSPSLPELHAYVVFWLPLKILTHPPHSLKYYNLKKKIDCGWSHRRTIIQNAVDINWHLPKGSWVDELI